MEHKKISEFKHFNHTIGLGHYRDLKQYVKRDEYRNIRVYRCSESYIDVIKKVIENINMLSNNTSLKETNKFIKTVDIEYGIEPPYSITDLYAFGKTDEIDTKIIKYILKRPTSYSYKYYCSNCIDCVNSTKYKVGEYGHSTPEEAWKCYLSSIGNPKNVLIFTKDYYDNI